MQPSKTMSLSDGLNDPVCIAACKSENMRYLSTFIYEIDSSNLPPQKTVLEVNVRSKLITKRIFVAPILQWNNWRVERGYNQVYQYVDMNERKLTF